MVTTFNPEISELVINEGGTVVYSSGNILLVSEISEELYMELLKSSYIDSLEILPLKRYGKIQTSDVSTIEQNNESVPFNDLSTEDDNNSENQSGASL